MMKQIFLLTGWGVGASVLQPLAAELKQLNYRVILSPLPCSNKSEEWLTLLAQSVPEQSYWVGWSLGGQLLSALTQCSAARCLGLITLATNPCFTASDSWQTAMPNTSFERFTASFKSQPTQTIQRFLQLIAQGCPESKSLVKAINATLPELDIQQSLAGLGLLGSLNVVADLQNFTGKQLHILAKQDVLVPKHVSEAIQSHVPHAKIDILPNTGHGFVITDPKQTALKIHAFFR